MRLTRITGGANTDGGSKDAPAPTTPLEILLGCHARIRHFMQLSRTLAEAEGVALTEIAEAAAAVFGYFSHALPLHHADENQSLFPRLRDALPPGALVREAAETMVEQHRAIDELVAELLFLCSSLRRLPEHLPGQARQLQDVTAALGQIFAAHLLLEETVVFPAFQQLLTPAQIKQIFREMHQRRQPPIGNIHLVQ